MPVRFNIVPKYENETFCEVWDEADKFLADIAESPFSTSISTTNQTLLYYLLYAKYGNSPIANRDVMQFKYKVFSIIFEYGPTWEKRLSIQDTLRSLTQQQLLAGEIETLTGTDTGSGNRNTTESGNRLENGTNNTNSNNNSTTERDVSNSGYQTNENDGTDITNHASNPPTSPVASSTTPLTYIDGQDYKTINSTVTRRDNLKTDDDAHTVAASTISAVTASTVTMASGSTVTYSNLAETDRTRTRTKDLLKGYAELWDLLQTDITSEFLAKFNKCFKQFVSRDLDALDFITYLED